MHRGTAVAGQDRSMFRLRGDQVGMGQLWPLSFPPVKEQFDEQTHHWSGIEWNPLSRCSKLALHPPEGSG